MVVAGGGEKVALLAEGVLKFSKINGIHYHYAFGKSSRVRVYHGGKMSVSTIFGILEKPRRARVQLRLFYFSAGARARIAAATSLCRASLWS